VTVRLIESKSPKGHLQAVTSGFLNLDRWEVYGNFDVGELQRGMEHITTTLIKEIPNLKDRRPLGLSVAEKAWRRATGYQLHLSREEWNTVEDYLEVVLLLVRCRNEARLEPSCWLGIVERLLTDMG
jgi:hypothetical protein